MISLQQNSHQQSHTHTLTVSHKKSTSEIYLFTNELKTSDSKQCQQQRMTAIQNLGRQLNFVGKELTKVQGAKMRPAKEYGHMYGHISIHTYKYKYMSESMYLRRALRMQLFFQFVEFWHFIEILYSRQQKHTVLAVFVVSPLCMPF